MNDNEINEKNFFLIYEYLYQIEDFNLNDIIIYSIIKGLSDNGKKCFATNSYFAKKIKKNNDTVRKSITKLYENGYINNIEDFNYKSNRVLTITNKVDAYLKTIEGLLKNDSVPLVKISNNNIVYNIYTDTTTTTIIEKISMNQSLLEIICEENKLKIETVKSKIDKFAKHCESEKKIHKNDSDMFKHFSSWIRKLNLKDDDLKIEFDWFLKMFNETTKRDFHASDKIKQLFAVQLANGFTGKDMRKAIENLYSSSSENKFHRESSFKFATPEYLLSNDNLNRYLNLKYR